MEKFEVGSWVGDRWVSEAVIASNDREAKQMVEASLKWQNPNEKVNTMVAVMRNPYLRRLGGCE